MSLLKILQVHNERMRIRPAKGRPYCSEPGMQVHKERMRIRPAKGKPYCSEPGMQPSKKLQMFPTNPVEWHTAKILHQSGTLQMSLLRILHVHNNRMRIRPAKGRPYCSEPGMHPSKKLQVFPTNPAEWHTAKIRKNLAKNRQYTKKRNKLPSSTKLFFFPGLLAFGRPLCGWPVLMGSEPTVRNVSALMGSGPMLRNVSVLMGCRPTLMLVTNFDQP